MNRRRRRKILCLLQPGVGAAAFSILVDLVGVSCRLHHLSLPDLLKSLDSKGEENRVLSGEDRKRAEIYRDLLDFILIGCFRVRRPCLFRSLALFSHYRRKGVPVGIAYGIRKNGYSLDGHSWLILDGAPFLERTDPGGSFASLYIYPDGRL